MILFIIEFEHEFSFGLIIYGFEYFFGDGSIFYKLKELIIFTYCIK